MKTLQKLAITTLATVLFIPFASAQATPTPEQMLPAGIDIVLNVDLTQPNPFMPWIEEWETNMNGSNVVTITEDGPASASEDEILFRLITQNPFTFAMSEVEPADEDLYPFPDLYIFGQMSESDFDDLIAANLYGEEEPTITEHNSTQIYELNSDMFLFHYNGIDIVTSSIESAMALIDTYENSGDSLGKTDFWQNSQNRLSGEGFFNIYVDTSFAISDPDTNYILEELGFNQTLIHLITGEIFGINQVEDGYEFEVYVEGDEALLEENDMMFDKYNFTPELYKTMSGHNIILYTENSGADHWKDDFLKTFSDDSEFLDIYDEMVTSIDEEIGINIDEDLFPYLTGNNAIAVHNSEQLMPAITAVFKSSLSFKDTLDQLNDSITDANLMNDSYQQQLHLISGQYFVHHMMNDPDLGEVDLWLGLTSDNLLVISTHHELPIIFRNAGDMTLNEGFAMNFEGAQSNTSSLFYMDFQNLADYIEYGMTENGATEEELQEIADFAAPWHNLYMISFADRNQTWGNGFLGVDHEMLAALDWDSFFEGFFFGTSSVYNDATFEPLEPFDLTVTRLFCDVQKDDWFYTYITDLSGMNVVQGYSDGCFRPNDPVTRAEFVKMMMAGLDAIDYEYSPIPTSVPAYFGDVNNEWFANYVNTAAANSFVEGYEDDTFRPNNSISRAEAVQALYGIGAMEKPLGFSPFTDVHSGDWFNTAVTAMYNANIISGKSQSIFDPHTDITRAEAAKIIDLYLDHIVAQMELDAWIDDATITEEEYDMM